MGIRECAMQATAFAQLMDIYCNRERDALSSRAAGKKVVAKLGFDVPDELIIAAGMFPLQVFADPEKQLRKTDTYLEFAFDPVVRKQFEKVVDGTYKKQADFLAISNSTDVLIRVFLYLREIVRINLEDLPPLIFLDWLFTRNRMHQDRNEQVVALFREQLEEWCGHMISDEDIMNAIHVCNQNRQALREMAALRRGSEVRISGSEALVIIGSAFFMDREKHTNLVRSITRAAAGWPVLKGPRIFVTGSSQESTELYDKIEDAGAVVVGEDHDWGDRFYNRDCNPDYPVVRSIVDRYMLRLFSSKKAFVSQRVEALSSEAIATKAQAVIFYTNIYEDAASWDYPTQKAALEATGIRTMAFSKMQYPVCSNIGLDAAIEQFIQELKEE